jgi:cytochrome b involved in lipid metabolism
VRGTDSHEVAFFHTWRAEYIGSMICMTPTTICFLPISFATFPPMARKASKEKSSGGGSKSIRDTVVSQNTMSKDEDQFPDKLFTWEEIRKHNKDTDCWVVMYGKVVDITKFLSTHPGGLDPINDMGGFDLTNQFEARGHSEKADRIWRKHVIGRVDPNSVPPKVVPKAPRGGLADKPVVADPKAKKASGSTVSLPVVFFAIAVVCAISFFVLYRSAE